MCTASSLRCALIQSILLVLNRVPSTRLLLGSLTTWLFDQISRRFWFASNKSRYRNDKNSRPSTVHWLDSTLALICDLSAYTSRFYILWQYKSLFLEVWVQVTHNFAVTGEHRGTMEPQREADVPITMYDLAQVKFLDLVVWGTYLIFRTDRTVATQRHPSKQHQNPRY